MSFDPEKGLCNCERCAHVWTATKLMDDGFMEPSACAKCKSKVWNRPRVYAGKFVTGTLARRFKPTGRAAAKLKAKAKKSKSERIEEILKDCSPEEKLAAKQQIVIWEMSKMLEELGLK